METTMNPDKRTMVLPALLLAGLLWAAVSPASEGRRLERLFGLGPVDTFTLESETLGRDFHIYVRLPRDYAESDCDWPVVYMLDGGILFPMLAPLHLMMEIDELAPPAVLVGISYGGLGYAKGNMRSTDYTAPAPEPEYYGGADDYQRFLAEELVPRIDAGYRVDHERSLVLGQSLGGQFTLYTALTRPGLFGAYLSINPALHRNLDYFLDLEPAARTAATPLMITRSSEEDARLSAPLDRWLQDWRSGGSSALALTVRPLEGQHHASSGPAAYLEAIRWWTTGWTETCRSGE
jgi:predicted alpha/beta superfamily hydrolase